MKADRAGFRPISPIASNQAQRFPGPPQICLFFVVFFKLVLVVVVLVESENKPCDFFFSFLLLFYFFLFFFLFFLTVKRHCVSLVCIFVPSNIVASVPLMCSDFVDVTFGNTRSSRQRTKDCACA